MKDRCLGKRAYSSYALAEEIRSQVFAYSKEPLRRRRRLQVYRCPKCQRFHIGHLSKASMRAFKQRTDKQS